MPTKWQEFENVHSLIISNRSVTDELKAGNNIMMPLSSTSTLTPRSMRANAASADEEEIWHPNLKCHGLEETLDRQQESKCDDEMDNVFIDVQRLVYDTLRPSQSNPLSEKKKPTFPQKSQRSGSCNGNHYERQCTFQYSVQFTHVTVREYPQILGENPGCSSGPSLTIAWEYCEHAALPVDEFESLRAPFRNSKRLLLLHPDTRERRLRRMGYSAADIAAMVARDNMARAQRQTTVRRMTMFEALVLSTKKQGSRRMPILPMKRPMKKSVVYSKRKLE